MARLRTTHKNRITHIELSRPDKKNAMDDEMINALTDAAETIGPARTGVVVLSVEGSCFCAGIDLAGMSKLLGQNIEELLVPRTRWRHHQSLARCGHDLAPVRGAGDRGSARRSLWRRAATGTRRGYSHRQPAKRRLL